MQSFTFGFGSWARNLIARNPLVRLVDRLEAAAGLLIVTVALVAVPIAGAVGTTTNDNLARQYAKDRTTRVTVTATAIEDSILFPRPYEEPCLTRIRWRAAGTEHTDEVRTHLLKKGETTTIWVDAAGSRTDPPMTDGDAATDAVVAGFGWWLTTVAISGAAWALVRLWLDHARGVFWDRELKSLVDNDGRTNHSA